MTDEQLFNQFESGDINALTELRARYYVPLSLYLRRAFSKRKRAVINAIIDEAWLTLSFTGFDPKLPVNVGSMIYHRVTSVVAAN